jgi:outer membrane protein assembly factor BamB
LKKIFVSAILGILCLWILFGFAPVVKSQQSSTGWLQYHGDSGHSGYTTDNGPSTNNTLWRFSLLPYGKVEEYSAAVANGSVYFSSVVGNLTCVNAATGATVWNYNTNSFEVSSPAVANGLVYFDCEDGNLYCLNAQTGELEWIINSTNTALSIGDAPLAVSNGSVYFTDTWTNGVSGQTYANITCADAATGELVWGYGVAFSISDYETAPTVANGCVYFTDGVGNFDCLNATDGAFVWSNPIGGYDTASVANGYVYYSPYGGEFCCLNAQTGTSAWNYTTKGTNYAVPAIANGNVYFGSDDGNFYCLNAQTGTKVWNYSVYSPYGGTYVFTGSVSGNGYVYFGDNSNYIYCLNAQTGTLVWQYQTGGSVDSLPAIANGVLYVGSWDGYMYAFGATPVPEFPELLIPAVFMLMTLLTIAVYEKRHNHS